MQEHVGSHPVTRRSVPGGNVRGKCRVCKCTQERACANGGWAPKRGDLCTHCAAIVDALRDYAAVAWSFNRSGLMREVFATDRASGGAS